MCYAFDPRGNPLERKLVRLVISDEQNQRNKCGCLSVLDL